MSRSSRRLHLITIAFALLCLTLTACGPKQAKIEYLAEVQGSTIILEGELAERITEIRRLKKVNEFLRVYWVSSDNVIFDLSEYGTFLFVPSTEAIRELEGAERDVVLNQIQQNVSIESYGTQAQSLGRKFFDIYKNALQFKGGGPTSHFLGTLEDGLNTSNLEIGVQKTCNIINPLICCSRAWFEATVKDVNTDTEVTFEWDFSCDYMSNNTTIKDRLSVIFSKLSKSPDARYIAYRNLLYDTQKKDPEEPEELIRGADKNLLDISINSAWDRAVVLMVEDPKMELYSLKIQRLNFKAPID